MVSEGGLLDVNPSGAEYIHAVVEAIFYSFVSDLIAGARCDA